MFGFKFRIASIESLCKDIENSTNRLKQSTDKIELLMPRVLATFDEIKEILPEFKKLHVKVAELEEYDPELQDLLHEKNERVAEKTSSIFLDLGRIFTDMEKSIAAIKDIIMDADAIIFKENKQLDKFKDQIKNIKLESSQKVLEKITETKEDLMAVARRLFETAKAEQKDIFPQKKEKVPRTPLSEQIKSSGIKIEEIGKILDHLNIDDIDEIVKNSEEQLENLERIEVNASLAIRNLEGHLIEIKNKLYLLEGEPETKIRKRIIQTEKIFDKAKADITKNAEKLLKSINIVKKIE